MVSEKRIFDSVGLPGERAVWIFWGAIPLVEIERGRRACREGWRDRGEGMDMLAAVGIQQDTDIVAGVQRESATHIEDYDGMHLTIRDYLAEDWYLEVPK